ncbi:SNF2 family DNA-dependent ATPase domain-containing protein [Zymoseptoria tritici IPO323]|uniref:SNF2 family DNA-dependent ATPase domain-containing protein n=1 Tax=Zymoseptoria tritici (strain CBS 115943 / IPO323) TaxID=336722 RepID=F9X189_ZYMTI|nr:SNF2 family DNA-dependent ATPase domain-containing protein [Zymoseptoria tritici IPO323]EGP92164.1 SNF2 family DNA-dependent ATPase domain-containing protein [Zymoseptoria tritici IPO323]
MNDYLALGCLCFKVFSPLDDEESSVWQEESIDGLASRCPSLVATNTARLLGAGWIRLESRRCAERPQWMVLRVYVLFHDAGHSKVGRTNTAMLAALDAIAREVDISPHTWQGSYVPGHEQRFDVYASRDDQDPSLYFLFNTLPSPSPAERLNDIAGKYAREALEDLLDETTTLEGLKTDLFPYQRRSAGAMLCREAVPGAILDPRLEARTAPDGSTFYYSARDCRFLRDPITFEACRGGILAETMGLGKTVICLSLLLATRHHLPSLPVLYAGTPVRPSVASLIDMAVSAVNRQSIPWRIEFDRIRQSTGDEMTSCASKLRESTPSYDIPPSLRNRTTTSPSPQCMLLTSATLIVVPRNLCSQWQSEILKHVEPGALNVLVMDDLKRALPSAKALCSYDVILFSRNRFDLESKHGTDGHGRRIARTPLVCTCPYIGASRTRDCHCLREDMLYQSPLKNLHFKRLIVDEGHSFSQINTNAVVVATQLVTAENRWLVSGTPAKDLLGVEVDLSSLEFKDHQSMLEQRRHFDPLYDRSGAIDNLGAIAGSFLKIQPWAPDSLRHSVSFKEHIYRHEDSRRLTYSGFSRCFQKTLESMVIKTQPKDVEITLPPLSHTIVRLQPSFYDKLTSNLFTLVLTANAVTSERTDADYLFHKNSHKERVALVSNVRQSSFHWAGFDEADVRATADTSRGYLTKDQTNCAMEDRELLLQTMEMAEVPALSSEGWKAMSRCHELGIVVENWPDESASHWSFEQSSDSSRILTGISQLLDAQRFVNTRCAQTDPGEGLAGAGIKALASARRRSPSQPKVVQQAAQRLTKSGIPSSSLGDEPALKKRRLLSSKDPRPATLSLRVPKHQRKQASDALEREEESLPIDSPYARGRVVGTTSAKMSYLISYILKHHQEEKILVFYEGDSLAFFIAQMLELLNIKHDIYARSLRSDLQSEYVVRFNETPDVRVLLMDVKCGAHGLNLCSASRVIFVNPVCRPSVEAQAIKRAHRIGQTRAVHVETLVLAGTIEEGMLERAQRMTNAEHIEAKTLEDDGGIREIIQNARCLPITREEVKSTCSMAALDVPQQLWGRPGWSRGSTVPQTAVLPSAVGPTHEYGKLCPKQTSSREGPPKKRARFGPLTFDERATEPAGSEAMSTASADERPAQWVEEGDDSSHAAPGVTRPATAPNADDLWLSLKGLD